MSGPDLSPSTPPGPAATPLRIGDVPYLNSEPLVWGLRSQAGVELLDATPRALSHDLSEGRLDAAIIPVGALLEMRNLAAVSGIAIGCDGPVASVLLFSRVALADIHTLALDASSRTSIVLGQLLLRDLHRVTPARVLVTPAPLSADRILGDIDPVVREADAFVIIGDAAMHLAAAQATRPSYPVVMDLGAEWKALTGLPFVFAVWALSSRLAPERRAAAAALLRTSAAAGLARRDEIARERGPSHGIPPATAAAYLSTNIRYALGERERAGLAEFARRAAAHALIDHPALPEWID